MNRDAKGKTVPSWTRYVEDIDAAGSLSGYKTSGSSYIGFGIYCSEEASVTFMPIENEEDITMTLLPGYHPISCKSVTTTDVKIQALFPYNPN
jgi:hypothetical protein